MRTRITLACCITLALACGACVPAEEENDQIPNFDPEENIMGQIQQDGVLKIGIEADAAPWSALDGTPKGFNVDLGLMVADSLGVEAEFTTAERDDLAAMVDVGDVHIAFPLIAITEDLLVEHGLTDPYFVAHQRLLVPDGSGVEDVDDLGDRDICSFANESTGADVGVLNSNIGSVVAATDEGQCFELLRRGRVDAITGPDILLLTIQAAEDGYIIVGDQLTTEGYGAVVSRGTGGFDGYVDGIFAEADKELDWTELFDEWVSPVTGEAPPPFPTMNLEEAAALYPATS